MIPPRESGEFSIASWNVHLGQHNDGGRNDIAGRCRDLDSDVIVLQEAWWYDEIDSRLAPTVAADLGYDLHWLVANRPDAGVDTEITPWSIAMLTRIEARRLADHLLPPIGRRERHELVRIELVESGLTLAGGHLYGIHALARRPIGWWRELRAMRAAAARTDIIAGDMNMWGPVVELNARPLRRAVRGRTWPSRRPHSQIDHILVSDRVEVIETQVLDDMGSDHRAVRAVLRRR